MLYILPQYQTHKQAKFSIVEDVYLNKLLDALTQAQDCLICLLFGGVVLRFLSTHLSLDQL